MAEPIPADPRVLARLALARLTFPNERVREEAIAHLTAKLTEVLEREVARLSEGSL